MDQFILRPTVLIKFRNIIFRNFIMLFLLTGITLTVTLGDINTPLSYLIYFSIFSLLLKMALDDYSMHEIYFEDILFLLILTFALHIAFGDFSLTLMKFLVSLSFLFMQQEVLAVFNKSTTSPDKASDASNNKAVAYIPYLCLALLIPAMLSATKTLWGNSYLSNLDGVLDYLMSFWLESAIGIILIAFFTSVFLSFKIFKLYKKRNNPNYYFQYSMGEGDIFVLSVMFTLLPLLDFFLMYIFSLLLIGADSIILRRRR